VRRPSRAWGWSLLRHAWTLRHVAALYDAPRAAVRVAVRALQAAPGETPAAADRRAA